ncbi:MAG: hypothetical protein CO113_05585 [Elusimicrobia bacterium CG_4_9_14_3_um_filter_62_55]|nr:MAG: hypothetical protein COR54_08985 [Elusimicrobia bacterium CG22_combo_CG10-13_8_21_14_all_63_91]PJA13156.1 MAG: hypothetical protein COX66_15830 [Elusimicrobia bacterium CG_4_10_14_0_2_um_filter_63_34]PJB26081.1 MAG: hypothetical protein CO113_05585 [Elusimicrobia bacterium CG_4_9_14_3_um_filter_62_55]
MGSSATAGLTLSVGTIFASAPVGALFLVARVFQNRSSKSVFLKIFGIIGGMKLAVLTALIVAGDDVSGQILNTAALFPLLPESIVFPRIFNLDTLSFAGRCLRMAPLSLISSALVAFLLMRKHDQIIEQVGRTE